MRTQRPIFLASTVLVALAATVGSLIPPAAAASTPPTAPPVASSPAVARLDLTFVPNAGRYADVAFYTHALGGTVQFSSHGSTMILPPPEAPATRNHDDPRTQRAPTAQRLSVQFLGANSAPTIAPAGDSTGTLSLALNGAAATELPTFAGITYHALYPGVDLDYTGTDGAVKSTFTLAPHVTPDLLRWQYSGADSIAIEPVTGDLLVTLPRPAGLPASIPATVVREHAPSAWQETTGSRAPVAVHFVLGSPGTVGFALAAYDASLPLVIDPDVTLTSLARLQSRALAVDAAGRAYLAGTSYDGGFDLALTVVAADGTTVLSEALLAGARDEQASGAALAADGALWVSGYSDSPALSLSGGAQGFRNQVCAEVSGVVYYCSDGLLLRYTLEAEGSGWALHQQWGSYMGDAGRNGLVIRNDGVLVLASTTSAAADSNGRSALITALRWNATTAHLTPVYEQAFAGLSSAYPYALLAGSNGDVYVAGESRMPYDDENGTFGQARVWVARLDAAGALLRQTYLGSGTGTEQATALARDRQGNIYLAGNNSTQDAFPALAPLAENYGGGGGETPLIAFVAKLDAALNVRYASRIAGESAYSIAVDSADQVFVPTYRNYPDGVLVAVAPNGAGWGPELALGDGLPSANAAAIDANDTLYLAGYGTFARVGGLAPQPPVPQPPAYTISYYVQDPNPEPMQTLGCNARKRGIQGLVILGFGQPREVASGESSYGVKLVQQATIISIDQVEIAVGAFARGYTLFMGCQKNGQTTLPAPEVTIVVGTNNSLRYDANSKSHFNNPTLGRLHGRAWANLITKINMNLRRIGAFPKIRVAGGYDAEFDTKEWASTGTIQWAEGYSEQATALLYNYGTCESCPREQSRSTWSEGKVVPESNGADHDRYLNDLVKAEGQVPALERVYRLSHQIPWTTPLPQIYYAAYTYEWYNVRRYAYEEPRHKLLQFSGVTATCPATCTKLRSGTAKDWMQVSPTTEYLSAPQSWQALFDVLNRPTAPDGSATTLLPHSPMRYVTEVEYQ